MASTAPNVGTVMFHQDAILELARAIPAAGVYLSLPRQVEVDRPVGGYVRSSQCRDLVAGESTVSNRRLHRGKRTEILARVHWGAS